jgi:translation elongation factor EF-1alpha
VGRVESGTLKKGQEIHFFPGNIKAKIKFIKDFEKEIKKASAGQGIGIVLDKDIIIERGSVGFEKGVRPITGKILKGKIFWIDSAKSRKLICECGNAAAQGTILSPKKPIASAKSLYKISLDKCIVYDPESSGSLGKIVLKEDGKIIAVGNTL